MLELTDFLTPECVRYPLKAVDARGAIDELVAHLADIGLIENPTAISEIVWNREQQRSTGIGDGIAVPHGRCDRVKQIVAAIGLAPDPINFNAGDGKPVSLIVLLVSPTENTSVHVQALGAISRRLSDERARNAIRQSTDAQALFDLLCNQAIG